jgi:hypothetical protein
VNGHLRHPASMRLHRLDRFRQANVPQTDLASQAAPKSKAPNQLPASADKNAQARGSPPTDELAIPSSLHVHVQQPRVMMSLVAPNHVVARRDPAIVHLEPAVAETGDENVARDLIAGESRQARVGSSWKVLR